MMVEGVFCANTRHVDIGGTANRRATRFVMDGPARIRRPGRSNVGDDGSPINPRGIDVHKKILLPLLLLGLLTACGKNDGAPASAAPAPVPNSAVAAAPAPAAAGDALAKGEHVYKGTCAMCHGTGAGGAPMFKSHAEWEPRIAQGKETLYEHALKGFNGAKGSMPAKGGNGSLSDDDVKAGVDYMVSQAK